MAKTAKSSSAVSNYEALAKKLRIANVSRSLGIFSANLFDHVYDNQNAHLTYFVRGSLTVAGPTDASSTVYLVRSSRPLRPNLIVERYMACSYKMCDYSHQQ